MEEMFNYSPPRKVKSNRFEVPATKSLAAVCLVKCGRAAKTVGCTQGCKVSQIVIAAISIGTNSTLAADPKQKLHSVN